MANISGLFVDHIPISAHYFLVSNKSQKDYQCF
jgi:hypothetical protein